MRSLPTFPDIPEENKFHIGKVLNREVAELFRKPTNELTPLEIATTNNRVPYFGGAKLYLPNKEIELFPDCLSDVLETSLLSGFPLALSAKRNEALIVRSAVQGFASITGMYTQIIDMRGDADKEKPPHWDNLTIYNKERLQDIDSVPYLHLLKKSLLSYTERGYDPHFVDQQLKDVEERLEIAKEHDSKKHLSLITGKPLQRPQTAGDDLGVQAAKRCYIIHGFEFLPKEDQQHILFYCGDVPTPETDHLLRYGATPMLVIIKDPDSEKKLESRYDFLLYGNGSLLQQQIDTARKYKKEMLLREYGLPKQVETMRPYDAVAAKAYPALHNWYAFLAKRHDLHLLDERYMLILERMLTMLFHPEQHVEHTDVVELLKKCAQTYTEGRTHLSAREQKELQAGFTKIIQAYTVFSQKLPRLIQRMRGKIENNCNGAVISPPANVSIGEGLTMNDAYLQLEEKEENLSALVREAYKKVVLSGVKESFHDYIIFMLSAGNYPAVAMAIQSRDDQAARNARLMLARESFPAYMLSFRGVKGQSARHFYQDLVREIKSRQAKHYMLERRKYSGTVTDLDQEKYQERLATMPLLIHYISLAFIIMHDSVKEAGADPVSNAEMRDRLLTCFKEIRDDQQPLVMLSRLMNKSVPDFQEKSALHTIGDLGVNTVCKSHTHLQNCVQGFLPPLWRSAVEKWLSSEFSRPENFPQMHESEVALLKTFWEAQAYVMLHYFYSLAGDESEAAEQQKQRFLAESIPNIMEVLHPVLQVIDTKRALDEFAPVEHASIPANLREALGRMFEAMVMLSDQGIETDVVRRRRADFYQKYQNNDGMRPFLFGK